MAWLAGWMGGVHCVGMCGGIVAATSLTGGRRQPIHILLAYNAGRIGSYAMAGFLAGGLGAWLSSGWLLGQQILYGLAQTMLILVGLYLAGLSRFVVRLERLGGGLWQKIQPWLKHLLPVRTPVQAGLAGALWGWLPCGLVYSVLISALASASALNGATLMLAFGLGTLPNLFLMGLAAQRVRAWFSRSVVRRFAGLTVVAMGGWGFYRLLTVLPAA